MSKTNIHATCISYRDNGILLIGPSGSGKSDLALRMMMNKGAQLVADDRTDVEEKFGRLRATCPENIRGITELLLIRITLVFILILGGKVIRPELPRISIFRMKS